MKIALDLDGTLADIQTVFIREYNRQKGTSLKLEHFDTYHFEKAPFELEEFHQIARENWKSKDIPLTDSSLPSHLKEIAEYHTLDIVTARDDIKKEKLIEWLKSKNVPFESFIVDKKKTRLDYDILIDDCPKYLGDGMKVLLYHRCYNQNAELPDNSSRVRDFEQVKKHILRSKTV